jgi:ribose 5-phosphate isomerase RpiB
MAQPTINLDELVRDVLAQLGLKPEAPRAGAPPQAAVNDAPAAPKPEAKPTRASSPAAASTPSQLVVTRRVVTLSELGERLTGIRQVVVPAKAIVTPAARDELQRRKIALVRASQASASVSPPAGAMRLAAVVAGSAADPAAVSAALASEGIGVETEKMDCLIAATDRLAGQLSQGMTLGLLLTSYPAAALCLANRLAGVRAVLGSDAQTVAAATASVGANLLVVDPTLLGIFQLRQIVARFYREPKHQCPNVFLERLG